MAESVTEPDTDSTEEPEGTRLENQEPSEDGGGQTVPPAATTAEAIIWTPRFIAIFFLTLVAGLSAESLLTQGWLNSWYPGVWIFEAHIALVLGCLIGILIFARSWWIRLGCIFGFIWAIFMTVDILISLQRMDPHSLILAYVNASMSIALLGCFVCFSIYRMPFRAWDSWFFRLAAVFGVCAVAFVYFFPMEGHSWSTLVYAIALMAVLLSILTWWARPSCWKTQPGLTFLCGTMSAILFILSIYNRDVDINVFLYQIAGFTPRGPHAEPNFFFTQVALLALFLGTMRLLQSERCELSN